MSYDQWKAGMIATSVISVLLGVLILVLRGSGIDVLLATTLVPLLCTLVVLSFRKPKRLWAVATVGFAKGTNEEMSKSYGPFHSKFAAVDFRNGWAGNYKGFAVVEYRTQDKVDKH